MKLTAIVVCAVAALGCSAAKKEKPSPAQRSLDMIQRGAKAAFESKGAFPIGKVGPTPPGSCCDEGGKCKPMPGYWEEPVWQELAFSVDEPGYLRYSYE